MEWWQRLQQQIDELGWSKMDLHEKSGVSYDSINKYLRGDTAQPRGAIMAKLAEAIGKSELWLRDGIEVEESSVALSKAGLTAGVVAGKVEAGTFREVDEFDQSERIEVALPRDELFPNARQLIFDCSGDSMNDLKPRPILDGDRLVCIDYNDVEHLVELKSGMVVVVQRERDGGHFREWSVKQIELYPDRTEFHPRSTNPKHKPIVIQRDHEADDGVTVQVIGLVRRVMNEMPGF
ncbi:LexA family protein [Shinella granuli]|uniref:Helix-turn-helix protein n=1 Tax=Shinella granuli TaxID=323621 RepID=A0A4R2D743_SHIGR|nr:XRE family transcriptional regulator [Shinella granuli]TCN48074.1 helix-turn-helix protein [Shinella granuli]